MYRCKEMLEYLFTSVKSYNSTLIHNNQSMIKKSQGIVRNKTEMFLLCKEAKRKKSSRFAKESLLGLGEDFPTPVSPALRSPLVELEKMPTMSTLPPEWVDRYEECLSIIQSMDGIKKKILMEQNRRLSTVKMTEEKDAERKIYEYSTEATLKIKKCERLIEQIRQEGNNSETPSDRQTCLNICTGLALAIQEKTKDLRGQQRAFIEQRQHIENSTKVSFLQLAAEKAYDDDYLQDEYEAAEMEIEMKVQRDRNEEILKIVESIHELNDLYKELNSLVIMQGSLLDRIDFNIEESATFVKKGEQTLERVDERQKRSKCACRVISVMVLAMLILATVLVVKWSHKSSPVKH